jgi:hypothetical protein
MNPQGGADVHNIGGRSLLPGPIGQGLARELPTG